MEKQPDKPKSNQKKYWTQSSLNKSPEFFEGLEKEFVSSPLVEEENGFDRRDFMKLMAASTAMATAACYQKPMHKILPYVNQPEEITFGVPNYYASTCTDCATGCGTLVKTREGRPIKIEGNPDHPMNKGALCARGQASILNLYDPDRLRAPLKNGEKISWDDLDKELGEKLKSAHHVRLLTETMNSPTTLKLTHDFLSAFSDGKHVMFDAIGADQVVAGQEVAYGTKVLPRFNFSKADVIVAIDADFLGTWISPVEFTKQFTANRKLSKKSFTKFYCFESLFSMTGANADERVAIRPLDGASIAFAIAHELQAKGLSAGSNGDFLKHFSADLVAHKTGIDAKVIKEAAESLHRAQGKSLVVAGSPQGQTENGLLLQLGANLINTMLRNDGTTVDWSVSPSNQSTGSFSAMKNLISEMKAGSVDTLIIHRANPVYSLPASAGFEDALKKVKTIVYVGTYNNETAQLSEYVLADNHGLESWGDAEPQKNLFSLVQPTIRPIYDTRGFEESLIALNKSAGLKVARLNVEDYHHYLQRNWNETIYKTYNIRTPFISFWETSLRDGVFDGIKKSGRDKVSGARSFKANLKDYAMADSDDVQVAFYPTVNAYDGSSANNPWLQEMPDPITKIVWDNYASMSPTMAKAMSVKDGDFISIKMEGNTLEIPAHVQPGMNSSTIAVALGYGRTAAGKVGTDVGKNAFKLASFGKSGLIFSGQTAKVNKTGETYILSNAQERQSLENRPIVREGTYKEWLENPKAGNEEADKEKEDLTTVWPVHKYEGYRWAMTIDLNSCTGCNACVIACQSENNIPVVGKDSVNRGRIMHWIRIDRYYTGTPDAPTTVHQPMLCQHCENAPCETVCPVIATMHDSEGLNAQIYNRCVGTRYCANNCPYKVRRFNWFEYNYGGQTRYPRNLAQNPEVTVRSRGIMEKCTFCIQRIHEGKNIAKNEGRKVRDGEIKPACAQTCPGDAIVFGNVNDPESEVSKNSKNPRGYHVLEELNTRPSVTYLTKIKNAETT